MNQSDQDEKVTMIKSMASILANDPSNIGVSASECIDVFARFLNDNDEKKGMMTKIEDLQQSVADWKRQVSDDEWSLEWSKRKLAEAERELAEAQKGGGK